MITYRSAGPDDAGAISALFAESFTATFGHLYAPADLAAFLARLDAAGFAAEIADPRYRVRLAEAEGRAVAFAKLGPPALPTEPSGVAVELRQLYVLGPWQGAGVAAALMDWTIEEAQAMGADELFLSVYVDNGRARRFYERYGFVRVGRYDFMVGTHRDEDEIMRLTLPAVKS